MLVYTSGTTGPPKGASSQRNLIVTVDKPKTHFRLDRHNYEVVCYLPQS